MTDMPSNLESNPAPPLPPREVGADTSSAKNASHGRRLTRAAVAIAVVAVLLAVVAGGGAVIAWNKAGAADRAAQQAQFDVNDLRDQVDQLTAQVAEVAKPVDAASTADLAAVSTRVEGVSSSQEDLRACVNEYMTTISRWSRNVNSRYNWVYC